MRLDSRVQKYERPLGPLLTWMAQSLARVTARLEPLAALVAAVRHGPGVVLGILHFLAVAIVVRWIGLLLVVPATLWAGRRVPGHS